MAIGQVIGQIWDAVEHLKLSHGGPVAWTLIVLGFVGVPLMLWIDGRRHRAAPPPLDRATRCNGSIEGVLLERTIRSLLAPPPGAHPG